MRKIIYPVMLALGIGISTAACSSEDVEVPDSVRDATVGEVTGAVGAEAPEGIEDVTIDELTNMGPGGEAVPEGEVVPEEEVVVPEGDVVDPVLEGEGEVAPEGFPEELPEEVEEELSDVPVDTGV